MKLIYLKIASLLVSCVLVSSCSSNRADVSPESQHKTKVWILENNPQIEHPFLVELFDQLYLRLREGYLNLGKEIPKNVKVIVIENEKIGVFSLCDGSIFISTGTMKKLESAHQLISLLAHDISHIELEHACVYSDTEDEVIEYETDADSEAVSVLTASHIDPGQLKEVYLNVYQISEKLESSNLESLNSKRLKNLEKEISRMPEIDTKIPQERLFRKVKQLLISIR